MKQQHEFNTGANKELDGKLRMDLITPEMMIGLAKVLDYGTKKYADRNWEKGIPFMTSVASILRHLTAFIQGIDTDEESGLLHIEQVMTNAGFIVTQMHRGRIDLDNRPNTTQHPARKESKSYHETYEAIKKERTGGKKKKA